MSVCHSVHRGSPCDHIWTCLNLFSGYSQPSTGLMSPLITCEPVQTWGLSKLQPTWKPSSAAQSYRPFQTCPLRDPQALHPTNLFKLIHYAAQPMHQLASGWLALKAFLWNLWIHHNHTDPHKLGNKLTQIHSSPSWQPSWIPPYWIVWTFLSHTNSHKLWNSNSILFSTLQKHIRVCATAGSIQVRSKRKVVKTFAGSWILDHDHETGSHFSLMTLTQIPWYGY